jgi:hypothetical protein
MIFSAPSLSLVVRNSLPLSPIPSLISLQVTSSVAIASKGLSKQFNPTLLYMLVQHAGHTTIFVCFLHNSRSTILNETLSMP